MVVVTTTETATTSTRHGRVAGAYVVFAVITNGICSAIGIVAGRYSSTHEKEDGCLVAKTDRMRKKKRERKGEAVRLEHHPRIAICFNKQRSVYVTSLGRLTPCKRMTNFWARDNNKENMIAAKSVGSLWYKKFYFYFDFSRSFCCSIHADNVQSSAVLISADSDPHTETKNLFDVFNRTLLC